jgi:dTDP-4-amino-4,6-dideoxygalactose transaminase
MERRTGRECIFMPSGRIALLSALRVLLSPGDHVLMSTATDDVIFFIVLAAGLRPVAAPLSCDDGNIDVDAIPESIWRTVRGVLTTNLYGLPDRVAALRARCERQGLVLIEDVAHAIATKVDGAYLGSFGAAAAFSLSKNVDAYRGGVLAIADRSMRKEFEQARDAVLLSRSLGRRCGDALKPGARALLRASGVLHLLQRSRESGAGALHFGVRSVGNHRMELRAEELRHAVAGGPQLDAFEAWTRVDRHDYRLKPGVPDLQIILKKLHGLDADSARRIEGVERLRRAFPSVTAAAQHAPAQPLFRLPLLVQDREAAMGLLARNGIVTRYIYDPPLDDYAGQEFMERSPSPHPARWWLRHALPVDPLKASDLMPALRDVAGLQQAPAGVDDAKACALA